MEQINTDNPNSYQNVINENINHRDQKRPSLVKP